MTSIHAEADTNRCAHCGKEFVAGDTAVAYIEPDAAKTGNVVKMMIHEACAPAFFGRGVH